MTANERKELIDFIRYERLHAEHNIRLAKQDLKRGRISDAINRLDDAMMSNRIIKKYTLEFWKGASEDDITAEEFETIANGEEVDTKINALYRQIKKGDKHDEQ